MNALLAAQPLRLRPLKACDLDRVLAVEQRAYSFPWTRGNFIDALAAGYLAELWVDAHDDLVGYHVAMVGVDELHLLNLTVAPQWQRLGHARSLLDALEQHCRQHQLGSLWLEVRAGNQRARQVYSRRGFVEVGLRRNYYPAAHGSREDAIVMSLAIAAGAGGHQR
ncbi:MAG: ribosomal protein S18-alanine N-acetyltransferase [Rubrivivax sp.]|nr:ribosomal protein S18-alanine N-acetyltransferase [Rubrivivax sp.]